jgi:hypothetical protein
MVVESPQSQTEHTIESSWPTARIVQWAATAAIVLVAEIVFFKGYAGLSYLLDAVAVGVFFGLRKARENS